MYIYLVSAPIYKALSIAKIGMTQDPKHRLEAYLTGCPPRLSPSHDLVFEGLWLTDARDTEDLYNYEDEVHNQFMGYRMIRERPGDSEWFDFRGKNPYTEMKKFMDTRQWVLRQVKMEEIEPKKKLCRFLQKNYYKNLHFVKTSDERIRKLKIHQQPVIESIQSFLLDPNRQAGYVIAPCGSGKTMMAVKSLHALQDSQCVICCPSQQIQKQWADTLLKEKICIASQILLVGGGRIKVLEDEREEYKSTTDSKTIQEAFKNKNGTFYIISTYMSSHLLMNSITSATKVLILDEAHHMAGIVSMDEEGSGRTRRLLLKAVEFNVKRLSLTYTPRLIIDSEETDDENQPRSISMDDKRIFGENIAELKIRDLIRDGILPDYRLWVLGDSANKGTGILAKAECILEAWQGTEIIRGEEKPILHHLVVFAQTNREAEVLEGFFLERIEDDTLILRVKQGDSLESPKKEFTKARRAILINCFVLSEGVDIPAVNAVAITYPKQARGQITQMILRAGRWYEEKSLFHVILPTLGEEDLSGFEEVLCALASCDDQLRDEVFARSVSKRGEPNDGLDRVDNSGNTLPECIMFEVSDADQEQIRRCFTNVRKNFFSTKDQSRKIQRLCVEKGIGSSIEYEKLREDMPELLEDPRPKNLTWYHYLHPHQTEFITPTDFVNSFLIPNHLCTSHSYISFKALPENYPNIQQINDGYFGIDNTNLNGLIEKYRINRTNGRR